MGGQTRTVGLAAGPVKELDAGYEAGLQWAVFIAVGKYRHWGSLLHPVPDAEALREVLQARYRLDRVETLYDEAADKAGVMGLFKRLQKEVGAHDSLLVFYAGHGCLDRESSTGFWVPYDGGRDLLTQTNWIPNVQIRGMIKGMQSRHVCLVADSCFSGDILNLSRGAPPTIDEAYFRRAYGGVSRQALTSGASEEVPDESEFTHQLRLALAGNTRPYLDPLALFEEVRRGVTRTRPLLGEFKDCGHQEGAGFLLFLKGAGRGAAAEKTAGEAATPAAILVKCPLCGKKNDPKETFDCPGGCGAADLCLGHQVKTGPGRFVCEACADELRRAREREEAGRRAREEAETQRLAKEKKEKAEAERREREEAEGQRRARERAEATRRANTEAIVKSGELGRFARERRGAWDHAAWQGLLASLRRDWPEGFDEGAVGADLEGEKQAVLAGLRQEEDRRRAEQKEEADRRVREESERIAREEAEQQRRAKEKAETERRAREEAERQRQAAEEAKRLAAAKETSSRKAGQVWTDPVAGLELVWVPPGRFRRGPGEVTLSRGFWLGKYPVTQGQWEAVMGSNPSLFRSAGKDAPVEMVSWDDCQKFLRKLNAKAVGEVYRLPTEAEWEYACRAGTEGERYGDLDDIAWYEGNSGEKKFFGGQKNRTTHPVGQKRPNDWGLYDMLGNVWEWCSDWYGDYPSGSVTDPRGPSSGSYRVDRGGGWDYGASFCRSAFRLRYSPDSRILNLGFRLARGQ